jgi:formate C-acetyltransferase
MNERLLSMRDEVRRREQRSLRQVGSIDVLSECDRDNLSWPKRVSRLIQRQCLAEHPVIGSQERIVFTRTLPSVPPVYSSEDWSKLIEGYTLHELGPVSNICADWSLLLKQGLLGRRQVALDSRARLQADPKAVEFLDCAVETIDAVLELVGRYADEAHRSGRDDLVSILEHVPAYPARTFYEALQSLRFGHSIVWLGGNYHVGLGRFDQYMYPYLQADLDAGRLTISEAEQLVTEFFISLNKDSDLYPGVQQGDNGQSLTLGGVKPDGSLAVNELSRMVLRVSRDLELIDPKINLRISPDTDLDLLALATELTCKGLGFPQYSNDAVVIPALLAHGYDLEDARGFCIA